MHTRSPWILSALALLLFGYIWVFERDRQTPPTPAEERVFPHLDPARVSAITIVMTNEPLRLVRVRDRWQLQEPDYPAQNILVDNWLQSIAELRARDRMELEDVTRQPGGLASLGLDPPRASVTLEQGDQKYRFLVGAPTPLGPSMYLQVLGSVQVIITGSEPRERLPANPVAWRDPQFLQLAGVSFNRVQMRAAAREYEAVRDPVAQRWRLTRPRPARADHGRMEQIIQQLQAAQVQRFVVGGPVADLEPFGLQTPEAVITLSDDTRDVLTLEFGRAPAEAPELVYARRSNQPGIVAVARDVLELAAVNYTDLLDYRLIDQSLAQLERLEIRASEDFTLERATNSPWKITAPSPIPTDPGLAAALVEQLKNLRIAEVAKEVVTELDLPTYGLAQPEREIRLHFHQDSPASTGTVLRLDFGARAGELVYVRRSDENPVYTLTAADVESLPDAAFKLRDRRLWQFTTNEVVSFSATLQGNTQKLIRSARGQWTVAPGSQAIVNTFALQEALYRLGSLRARWWVDRGSDVLSRYGILPDAHRLTLEVSQDGQISTLTLDFGATSPSGGPFTATVVDGETVVFECPLDVFYPYDEVVRSMSPPR